MSNKWILVGIAIAAIGLIALPQTLAMFVGQHNWYDITTDPATNYGVPCAKCHADVYQELQTSVPHASSTSCGDCHVVSQTNKGETLGGADGNTIHAAAAPRCLDCHDGSWLGAPDGRSILTGAEEVHKTFASEANNSAFLKGENEACIACHTHVAVDITWTKATNISLTATEQTTPTGHTWSVGNFAATGTVIVKTSGNAEGVGAVVP